MLHHGGVAALVLLLVGGLLYTVGAVFYALRAQPLARRSATTSSSTPHGARGDLPPHRHLADRSSRLSSRCSGAGARRARPATLAVEPRVAVGALDAPSAIGRIGVEPTRPPVAHRLPAHGRAKTRPGRGAGSRPSPPAPTTPSDWLDRAPPARRVRSPSSGSPQPGHHRRSTCDEDPRVVEAGSTCASSVRARRHETAGPRPRGGRPAAAVRRGDPSTSRIEIAEDVSPAHGRKVDLGVRRRTVSDSRPATTAASAAPALGRRQPERGQGLDTHVDAGRGPRRGPTRWRACAGWSASTPTRWSRATFGCAHVPGSHEAACRKGPD